MRTLLATLLLLTIPTLLHDVELRYISGDLAGESPYVGILIAQEGPAQIGDRLLEAPVLTAVQKLQVQNGLQKIEIAQLHLQAAQAEFEKARTETTTLLQTLMVKGWQLDLSTLTYTKAPEPTKEQK